MRSVPCPQFSVSSCKNGCVSLVPSPAFQAEFAADLLRELGKIDPTVIRRATMALVSIQIYKVVEEHGEQALADMLRINPANFIRILNGLCNVVDPTIKLEKYCRAVERERAEQSPTPERP